MKIKQSCGENQPFLFRAVFFFIILSWASSAFAESDFRNPRHFAGFNENLWGAGVVLGEPTGFRAVHFMDWKRAWSFSGGYSLSSVLQVSADYLFYGYRAHDRIVDSAFFNSLIFYGGGGAMVGYGLPGSDPSNSSQIALRIVGGAEYLFIGSPWSIRLEAVPEIFFKGKNSFAVGLGMGITYYWFDGAKPSSGTNLRDNQVQAPIDESEFGDGPPAVGKNPQRMAVPGNGSQKVQQQQPKTQTQLQTQTQTKIQPEKNHQLNQPPPKLKPKPSPPKSNEFDEFN